MPGFMPMFMPDTALDGIGGFLAAPLRAGGIVIPGMVWARAGETEAARSITAKKVAEAVVLEAVILWSSQNCRPES